MKSFIRVVLLLIGSLSLPALAQSGVPLITTTQSAAGGTEYSLTLQLLILMTALTLLPSMLLMMTSFTRIIIVLSLLRQALGTAQTPPNQVLLGVALFLTIFIMMPVFTDIYTTGLAPYFDGSIDFETAVANMQEPLRVFMLNQTRQEDIAMFAEIARAGTFDSSADIPFTVLVPSFVTSELKSAFTIGFLIYIPFIVIDLVVASVLMSMGMMMLSPMMISMPFKLMLFVLVDGWTLIMGSLASSFAT
ncbi:MAG: flagellar type III secretion system pore protein FliP [Aequoribacter sp.]|jgi:flagellar biosynthetic protein FliP|uniref:flagellar type III secretion system pore protein FliP n=1 Tax=Aequoribacter sp. TaxID=2847771 RepID=UPI003C3973C1